MKLVLILFLFYSGAIHCFCEKRNARVIGQYHYILGQVPKGDGTIEEKTGSVGLGVDFFCDNDETLTLLYGVGMRKRSYEQRRTVNSLEREYDADLVVGLAHLGGIWKYRGNKFWDAFFSYGMGTMDFSEKGDSETATVHFKLYQLTLDHNWRIYEKDEVKVYGLLGGGVHFIKPDNFSYSNDNYRASLFDESYFFSFGINISF